MASTTSLRIAQALGITSAAFLSGSMFSISIMAIPAFQLAPPSISLNQFSNIYALGKVTTPPSLLLVSSPFFYLSHQTYSPVTHVWRLYLVAGTFVWAVLPLTFAILEKTNWRLLALAKKEVHDKTEVKMLLEKWKVLNLARSVMLAFGAGIGAYAIWQ